jgi:hypothetical protein
MVKFDFHISLHRDTIVQITNKMQYIDLFIIIYYSQSALPISGDVFAHHQKHLTVFTVSVSLHPRCCRLVSLVNTTRYFKYSQVLLMMGENIPRNL